MSVVKGLYRDLYLLMEVYGFYFFFDDIGWYGFSYVRIYELFGF